MNIISPVTEKCIGDVGIDINVVENARKGDLPDDENLKKYLLCIFNTMDLIDKQHHEFEFWKVLTMIPPEMKRPVFELGKGCLHISGEDYGKACLEFMTCLKKGNPEKFSFIF
ncbi:general odorant-binding protein 83a-like [Arctopsyche grandis]|uniref:general odorant-binding protein 83a-like n=1 Tax=Arctopsyche grandis TaxID=121162 RepID=UPI00406D8AD9